MTTDSRQGLSDPASESPAPPPQESEPRRFVARTIPADDLLRKAIRIVEQGRPMPLSSSVIVNRDEVLDVLRRARAALPEEMRAARWLLKERDDMRARMKREGEDIVSAARARAERMVQRSELVKSAELRARRTVSEAEAKALRMKLETEDWCDQRLAAFEALLHKTVNAVSAGRQRLQDTRLPRPSPSPQPTVPVKSVFDQDWVDRQSRQNVER